MPSSVDNKTICLYQMLSSVFSTLCLCQMLSSVDSKPSVSAPSVNTCRWQYLCTKCYLQQITNLCLCQSGFFNRQKIYALAKCYLQLIANLCLCQMLSSVDSKPYARTECGHQQLAKSKGVPNAIFGRQQIYVFAK